MSVKPPKTGSKLTVVVIDDHAASYRNILSLLDVQSHLAISGGAGILLVQDILPDVILLDNNLPDMRGYDVARQLLRNPMTAKIPIIMVSAEDEREQRETARAIGIHAYIPKPLDAHVLHYKITQVLKREVPLTAPDPTLVENQMAPAIIGALFNKPPAAIVSTLRFMPRTTWAMILTTALQSKRLSARGRAVIALAAWQKEPHAPFASGSGQRAFWGQVRHSLASSTADDAINSWGQLATIANALIKPHTEQGELLKVCCKEEYWLCRQWALRLLMMGHHKDAAALAVEGLRDDNDEVRYAAAEVLGAVGNQAHLIYLAQAVNDRKASVRQQAARSLAKIDPDLALEVLSEALIKSRSGVAETATFGLELLGSVDAVAVLSKATRKRSEPPVLRQIAHTLGAINSPQSVQALRELANHGDASVRQAAQSYLEGW